MYPYSDLWINVSADQVEEKNPPQDFKCIPLDDEKDGGTKKMKVSNLEKVSQDLVAITKSTSMVQHSQKKVKHFFWFFSASNLICYVLVFVIFSFCYLATENYENQIQITNRLLQKHELFYNTSVEMLKINSAIIKFLGFLMYFTKDEPPRNINFDNIDIENNNMEIEKIKKALLMDALVSRLSPVQQNKNVEKLNLNSGVEVRGLDAPLKKMIEAISLQASDNKIILLLGDIDLTVKMGVQIGEKKEGNFSNSHKFQVLQIFDDDGLFVKFQALDDPANWPNMAIFCLLDKNSPDLVEYYQVQKGSIMKDSNDDVKILYFGTFVLGSSDFAPFANADDILKYAFILYNDNSTLEH